jgi:hypothetical protein
VSKLIVLLFLLCSCSLFQKTKALEEEAVEVEAEPLSLSIVEKENPQDKLARTFAHALIYNKVEELELYLPTIELVKQIAPNETEKLTNTEIEEKMLTPIISRFNDNFNLLQQAIKKEKTDKKQLEYSKYVKAEVVDFTKSPQPIEIVLSYGDRSFSVPITVTCVDGQCSVFEILKTTNIFSE